jgi:hypothetical protein
MGMREGGHYLVKIYIDEQTGRVAATEKIEYFPQQRTLDGKRTGCSKADHLPSYRYRLCDDHQQPSIPVYCTSMKYTVHFSEGLFF